MSSGCGDTCAGGAGLEGELRRQSLGLKQLPVMPVPRGVIECSLTTQLHVALQGAVPWGRDN